jgi:hypothetical protein
LKYCSKVPSNDTDANRLISSSLEENQETEEGNQTNGDGGEYENLNVASFRLLLEKKVP